MPDFFVSYTSSDEAWAEWIAWTLEAAGFEVVLQKWDFAAGTNFVLQMQRAAIASKCTIAVLSPDYLANSRFGAAEWAAAFTRDPDGMARAVVPVKVRPCEPEGLLNPIVHVDIVGLGEDEARRKLLAEVTGERRKPATPPLFPAAKPAARAPHPFPGAAVSRPAPHIPKIRRAATDLDKRRFIKESFDLIRRSFDGWLNELAATHAGIQVDLAPLDATKFTAEVFINEQSRAICKIWIGGLFGSGNDIAYAEGQHHILGGNSLNEALTLVDGGNGLALRAMMNMGIGNAAQGLNPDHMSPEDAAQYLWRRFCWVFGG